MNQSVDSDYINQNSNRDNYIDVQLWWSEFGVIWSEFIGSLHSISSKNFSHKEKTMDLWILISFNIIYLISLRRK